jgi:putative nucleotidyltransferase with HDIG domain
MVAEILNDKGYEAVRTTDPLEAAALLTERIFAAAVLDLVMPTMSGLELAERIRTASPDTEILILTGHADVDSAIEGIQHRVFDYLQKDTLQIPRLERAVHAAVEKSRLSRHNRELVDRLRESNRLLLALQEMATTLVGEPHPDRVLAMLVRSAKDLCGAASGRALLFERTSGDGLLITGCVGDGGETLRGARLQPGEGIAAHAFDKDETLAVALPKDDARYSHRCDEMPTPLPGLLCAPLRHGQVQGVLMLAGRRDRPFGADERASLARLARLAAVAIENALAHERSVNFFTHTCELLVSILEDLDIYYSGHSRGVASLCDMVTRRMGLGDSERRSIHFAALLHDIGKIRIDPAILKAAGYSDESRRLMREHPALGLELLKPITMWEDILPIIHAHHERWDGKGYPRGLSGEEIPVGARVVAVADAFDAMIRDTPHGPLRTAAEALAELEAFAGTQFDPLVVRLFVAEYGVHRERLKT